MKTKTHIRLDLGGCSWLGDKRPANIIIHNMSNHELEDGYPTLRDVAIIFYMCVGSGARWNLARELSNRTGFDIHIINETLEEILQEYAKLSEEEGYEKWNKTASYIETKKSKACLEKIHHIKK